MVKVSLLIPIYNAARYLRICLDSVMAQTLSDIEVICINDGSSDESLSIVREYMAKHPMIRLVDKRNSGYGHSLNEGLKVAKGKYVGIVESDDFVEPQMFECLYNQAEQSEAEVIKSNFFSFYSSKGNSFYEMLASCPYGRIFEPVCIPQIFFGEIYLWTGLYRLDFLKENDIWFNETPGASFQDVSFTFKVYASTKRMMAIRDAFYHYRKDNADSSVNSPDKVYCICDEFEEIRRWLSIHRNVAEKTRLVVPYMQFKRYMATYDRIAQCHKRDFLSRMISEFSEMRRYGEIETFYWQTEEWERLQNLNLLYLDLLEKEQDLCLYLFGLKEKLVRFEEVYIYGAGKIGREVATRLKALGVKINGFVVTDMQGNEEIVADMPVRKLSSISATDDTTFIVAVKRNWQYEIVEKLHKMGAKRVIIVDAMLRRFLAGVLQK